MEQPSTEILHSKTVFLNCYIMLFLCFSAKPKSEVHVSIATPVTVSLETISNQNAEQPTVAVPPTTQQPPPSIPSMMAAASPPSQPAIALSTLPGAVPTTPPTTAIAAAPTPAAPVGGTPSAILGPPVPEIKVKEEAEPVDIPRPVSSEFPPVAIPFPALPCDCQPGNPPQEPRLSGASGACCHACLSFVSKSSAFHEYLSVFLTSAPLCVGENNSWGTQGLNSGHRAGCGH